MDRYYTNEISLCKKDVCVHVKGEIANAIAATVFVSVVLLGLAELSKSLK